MDPRPTAPTPELEHESPQERLERERHPRRDDPEAAARLQICRALSETGTLRNEELTKAIGFEGDPAEWKRRLWRLHNEGFLKIRWVGMADPDPVEVRLTERGREILEADAGAAEEVASG